MSSSAFSRQLISLQKLHKVYSALVKHFPLDRYTLYYQKLIYKKKPACRVYLAWRLHRRLFDKVYIFCSSPLYRFPPWLHDAFDYESKRRFREFENEKTVK